MHSYTQGPGAYDLSEHKARFGSGPGTSLKGRHGSSDGDPTPGPNAYNPQLDSRDGVTMAGRGNSGAIDDTPGLCIVLYSCISREFVL